ncbi:MAG: HAD hydrolase family protein [Planctomycetes bacterium]|nr:HAD hydrolase family protein [Planctomycetota bacterium]
MSATSDLRLIVLDVDGVLTDGTIMLGGDEELKAFSTKDGAGLALWRDAGYHATFLTGRGGEAVRRRARELRIPRIWEQVRDKARALDEVCAHFGVPLAQTVAMGDDLPDLPMLRAAGFSACPSDAVRDVRECVDWIAPSRGGHGAVRDLVEHVLRERGEWSSLLERLL